MELKLSLPPPLPIPTPIFINSSTFLPHNHFALLAERWKLHIRRISYKGQGITNKFLLHLVKGGETLTSTSKLDAVVPILENSDAGYVNLVFEGKRLHIRSPIAGVAQVCHFEGKKLHKIIATGFGLRDRHWKQIFTVPTPALAKTTGSFLVLVPLIAFCIQCIMAAFQNRATRNLRHQAANKSRVPHHGSNSMRWKTVLSDSCDPEALDTELEPDSGLFMEDKEQLHFEDKSHTDTKVEDEYQKFLAECGMSKWGYWRGGSPQ